MPSPATIPAETSLSPVSQGWAHPPCSHRHWGKPRRPVWRAGHKHKATVRLSSGLKTPPTPSLAPQAWPGTHVSLWIPRATHRPHTPDVQMFHFKPSQLPIKSSFHMTIWLENVILRGKAHFSVSRHCRRWWQKKNEPYSFQLPAKPQLWEWGAEGPHPGDKAVSHVLRQLLVFLQLLQEYAAESKWYCIINRV